MEIYACTRKACSKKMHSLGIYGDENQGAIG